MTGLGVNSKGHARGKMPLFRLTTPIISYVRYPIIIYAYSQSCLQRNEDGDDYFVDTGVFLCHDRGGAGEQLGNEGRAR